MPECSIEGCGKTPHRRGWCCAHYERWRRHGDPLRGGTPNGEPLRFFQEVVLPYDGDECLLWPFGRDNHGYGHLQVNGKGKTVHRVVCERVHGPPPSLKHEAAHRCGRGADGCVTPAHLRWATRQENCADRLAHGAAPRGERNGNAKLTADDVRQIRKLRGLLKQNVIAAQFGVSESCVSEIYAGKKWWYI